mmetsp:Transcript_7916/g.23826  ORF Transcript_7916/g.23826 Transcript_7916/m.23826 type:complete len:207 (+) Transcript_7916:551-1171(+)
MPSSSPWTTTASTPPTSSASSLRACRPTELWARSARSYRGSWGRLSCSSSAGMASARCSHRTLRSSATGGSWAMQARPTAAAASARTSSTTSTRARRHGAASCTTTCGSRATSSGAGCGASSCPRRRSRSTCGTPRRASTPWATRRSGTSCPASASLTASAGDWGRQCRAKGGGFLLSPFAPSSFPSPRRFCRLAVVPAFLLKLQM